MNPIFFSVVCWRRLGGISPALGMEAKPSFREINEEEEFWDLEGRVGRDTQFETDVKNTKRDMYEFFACSLHITSAVFHNNYGFGAGLGPGNGGAILVSFCTVMLDYEHKNIDSFYNNKAAIGGAICCLFSNVYIKNARFTENVAFKFGGSIYFQGYEEIFRIAVLNLQCLNTDFSSNVAHDLGGAVLVTNTLSSYFEQCTFNRNKAGITGGAFYFLNSQGKYFDCSFIENEAGNREIRTLRSSDGRLEINSKISVHFRGLGGGAITFISSDIYMGKRKNRILYTQSCCFLGNRAHNGFTFSKDGNAAHVILFEGVCAWYSYEDYLGGDPKSAVGHVSKEWESVLYKAQYKETLYACDDYDTDNYVPISDPGINISFAKPKNPGQFGTVNIPEPTFFNYQPPPTDRKIIVNPSEWEYSVYPTTHKYPSFKERTVQMTPPPTKDGTPDPTILYPKRTPKRTRSASPKRTPKMTPAITPVMTPPMTPAKSPIRTPERTPINSPFPSQTFAPTPDTPSPSADLRWGYTFTDYYYPTITETVGTTFTKLQTQIDEPTVTKVFVPTSTVVDTYVPIHKGEEMSKTVTIIPTFTEKVTAFTKPISDTYLYYPVETRFSNHLTDVFEHDQTFTVIRQSSPTVMETYVQTGTYIKTYVGLFTEIKCKSPKQSGDGFTAFMSVQTTLLTYVRDPENKGEFILKFVPDTNTMVHTWMTYPHKCKKDISYYTRAGKTLTKTITNTFYETNVTTYTFIDLPPPTATPHVPSPSQSPDYMITSTRYSLIPSPVVTVTESFVSYTTSVTKETITAMYLPSVVFKSTFTKADGYSDIYTFTGCNIYTEVVTLIKPNSIFVEFSKTFVNRETTTETMMSVTKPYKGAYGSSTIAMIPSLYYTTSTTHLTYTWSDLKIDMNILPTKTNIITNCTTLTHTFTFVDVETEKGTKSQTVVYTLTNHYSYKTTRVLITDLVTPVLTRTKSNNIVFSDSYVNVSTIYETSAFYPAQTPLQTAYYPTPNADVYGQSLTNSYVQVCTSTYIEKMEVIGSTFFSGLTGIWSSTSIYSSTFYKVGDSFIYTYTQVPEMTYIPTETNGKVPIYSLEYTYVDTCVERQTQTKSNIMIKTPIYSMTQAQVSTFSTCHLMGTITIVETKHRFKRPGFTSILTQVDTFTDTVVITNVKTLITLPEKNFEPSFKDTSTVLSTVLFTKAFQNITTFIPAAGKYQIWTESKSNVQVCFATNTNVNTVSSSFTLMDATFIPTVQPPKPTKNLLLGKTFVNSYIGTSSKTYCYTYSLTKVNIKENPTIIWTETNLYQSTWTRIKEKMTIEYTYTHIQPAYTQIITEFDKDVKQTKLLTRTFTIAKSIVEQLTKAETYIEMNSFAAVNTKTMVPSLTYATSTLVVDYPVTRIVLEPSHSTLAYNPSYTAKSTFIKLFDTFVYTFTKTETYKPSVIIADKDSVATFIRMKTNVQTDTYVEVSVKTKTLTWEVRPAPTRTPFIPSITPEPTLNIYASPSYTEMISETYSDVFTYIIGSTTYCFRKGSTNVPTVEHIFTSTWTFDNAGKKAKRAYKFTEIEVISETYTSVTAVCTDIPTYTITSTLTYTDIPSTTLTYVTTGTNYVTRSLVNSLTETFTSTEMNIITKTVQCHFNNPVNAATYTNVFKGTFTNVVGQRSFTNTWVQDITMTKTNLRVVPTCTVIDVTTLIPTKTFTDSYTKVETLTMLIRILPTRTVEPTAMPTPKRSPTQTATKKPGQQYTYSHVFTSYSTLVEVQTSFMTFTLTKTKTFLNGVETIVTVPTSKMVEGFSQIYTITVGKSQIGFDAVDLSLADANANSLVVLIAATVSGIILVIIISLLVWFFVGYSKSSSSSDTGVNLDEMSLLHLPGQEQAPMTTENPLWTNMMGENDDPFRNDFEEVTAEGFFNERTETVDSDP